MTSINRHQETLFQRFQMSFLFLLVLILLALYMTPHKTWAVESQTDSSAESPMTRAEDSTSGLEFQSETDDTIFDLNWRLSWEEDDFYECEYLIEYPNVCVIRV